MGVSVNTVKTQIKLAYRKLKLELGGQNFVWEWTAGGVLFILSKIIFKKVFFFSPCRLSSCLEDRKR